MLGACERCRFWKEDVSNQDMSNRRGACRRYPPVVVATRAGAVITFPATAPAEVCGEYKGKIDV